MRWLLHIGQRSAEPRETMLTRENASQVSAAAPSIPIAKTKARRRGLMFASAKIPWGI